MPSTANAIRTVEPLMPQGWDVPQEFRDRLGDDVGRQRLMESEGHLLLVLHAPPKVDENRRQGRLFWRHANGDWKPQALKHGEHTVGDLLTEYETRVGELSCDEDVACDPKSYFRILSELNPLLRSARNLYEVLQAARQACKQDRGLILLRDRAYALSRQIELLQLDTKNNLELIQAEQAEHQAESSRRQANAAHRLNVLAALFFPVATLTAIFGMTLGHGLETIDAQHAPWPMLMVLGGGLTIGVILAMMLTRK